MRIIEFAAVKLIEVEDLIYTKCKLDALNKFMKGEV